MKKIIFPLLVTLITSCSLSDTENDPDLYHHVSGTIVSMNDESGITNDKYHKPVFCCYALVRDSTDTTLYVELSSYHYPGTNFDPLIDRVWYYNHHVGDKVSFDYINKKRYFHIK